MSPIYLRRFFSILMLAIAPVVLKAAVYPSNYDIVYHRISITVDPGTSSAITSASVTTYFKTRNSNFSSIGFDLDQAMNVSSVKYHGAGVVNTHSSNVLLITLPNIPVAGTLDSLTITYSGTPVAPVTSVPSGYNYNATLKCIYTLGESFRGNTWWPCRDSLVDKIDSVDVIITTPSAYRAGSNGVVTEVISGPNRICTWKTRRPIATYMINFCASNYVNYQFNATSLTHSVPVMNYLYAADNNATYQGYLAMLQNVMPAYSTVLNTDYPFWDEKYGTAECDNTGWGALEVQSMTFIDKTSYAGGYTLAHELAHQWFADKLTTGDWHQIWLNEGFAQYFERVVYPELLLGASTAATQRSSLKTSVTNTSTTYVSNISNADNIFIGSTTQPYQKGAMVLSMLRSWIGDTKFFTALHDYLNAPGLAYNFTYVDSLKKYMQMQTPNDLTNFFSDWVNQKGRVTYAVKYQYVTKGVYIQLTQSQTSAGAGYFDTPVPIQIKNSTGLDTTVVLIDRGGVLYNSVTGGTYNSNTFFYKLSATPTLAPVFDPNSVVLATASSTTSSATLNTLITLPVQDIELQVSPNGNNASINWKITADEPIESVDIQRSNDGISFETINQMKTSPISVNQYAGNFTDNKVGNGLQYYRLRVNKPDGSFVYSTTKLLNIAAGVQLRVSPNPVQNAGTINIPSSYVNQSQDMQLLIYNAAGLLIQQKKLIAGSTQVNVPCQSLLPGIYKIIVVNDKQQQLQTQLVKQ